MVAATEENSTALAGTALLRTITCTELRNRAPRALADLILAATNDGIFYLGLDDGNATSVNSSIEEIGQLGRTIFDLPVEEKLLFDVDTQGECKMNGYKPIGRNKGGLKGTNDGFESYAISLDTLTLQPVPDLAVRHPDAVEKHRKALAMLTSVCLDMAHTIFRTLSRVFDVADQDSFESRHKSYTSRLDLVRLLKYPNALGDGKFSIPQLAHADMGSLTFLFTASPGLQILPAGTETWLHVPPKLGHAVVNFGDAMRILSGGLFESVLHRVVTVPGKRVQDRYSFAFLMRPEPCAHMTALPQFRTEEGGGEDVPPMTCQEWVSTRFSQLRAR